MTTLPDAAVAFAVALAAAPLVLWVLRRTEILDVPSVRSSHQSATPRSGGVAPAVACVVAAVLSTSLTGSTRDALLVVSVGAGLIGLADDVHPRGALPRLLGQLAVAVVALIWLLRGLGGGVFLHAAVAGAMVVGLVGYVNAFNFMDGINGLAVAQVAVAGGAWWVIGRSQHVPTLAAAGLIAAAAALAFAPFNFPRARMFLGDVGSYFLGAWLAVAAIVGLRAGIAPEAMLAPLAIFLADAGFTLVQRVRRHEPWSQPHKQHVYQRLVQGGWSHRRTALVVGLGMAAVSGLGALSLTGTWALRVGADVAALIVVAAYLQLPGIVARAHRTATAATVTAVVGPVPASSASAVVNP